MRYDFRYKKVTTIPQTEWDLQTLMGVNYTLSSLPMANAWLPLYEAERSKN